MTHQVLLGRWRLTLELFGRVFVDDVGLEPGSLMSELGGFQVREARFRREMEKLRGGAQKDLTLFKVSLMNQSILLLDIAIVHFKFNQVDRARGPLIQQFFRELNTQYNNNLKKISSSSSQCPLAISRVKVTFRDEPGEGSGVARSFYSAIAEVPYSDYFLLNLFFFRLGIE